MNRDSKRYFATAPKHLGSLLAEELTGLGLAEATEARGGARFSGRLADAYRACLWSRVANRILWPLATREAPTPDALYEGARDLPWEEHLDPGRTFAVRFDGQLPGIAHPHFAALRVKDAIADRFMARVGHRPSVDAEHPDVWIQVHGWRGEATLSIDLAGHSLHRRGYRDQPGAAPLKENLAAALLLRAGWPAIAQAGGPLLDPMCGSGTLILEGAAIAADRAPGLSRARFGFEGWLQHDPAIWSELRAEAHERAARGRDGLPPLLGFDHDPGAIDLARAAAARAGWGDQLGFEVRELTACVPPATETPGLLIVNAPYGERLGGDQDLPALHAALGEILRERFQGWRAALFTADLALGKALGLRARRVHRLYNGPIECHLLQFEVRAHQPPRASPPATPVPAPPSAGAQMLANRLIKNRKALARWRRAESIDCYRLYDADLPEYALAIDLYAGEQCWVHVQEYAAPPSVDPARARNRLREAMATIPQVLEVPAEQVFLKVRAPQPGTRQYQPLAHTRHWHAVNEGGHRFWVNFEDYLDTGLFLDHRPLRGLIGASARDRRFLNLFGYTGTATVHAARGGASTTLTLDLSHTYLEWAGRNLALNGIAGPAHRLLQADAVEWLHAGGDGERFDLILLDPPSFSNSKRMARTLDIQRDHVALITATMRLLEPGGTLYFSTNLRRFRLDGPALSTYAVEDIGAAMLPRDFARNPRIHQVFRIGHGELPRVSQPAPACNRLSVAER